MRSLPGQQRLGPRDQTNQNTAYLDLSIVYGSDSCMAKDLRAFYIGKLNVTIHPIPGRKDLLPQSHIHPECKSTSGYCFIGGTIYFNYTGIYLILYFITINRIMIIIL